jgi:hypothetical protein
MPVFHKYDFWRYYISKPNIIQKVVRPTGYCNSNTQHLVKSVFYDQLDEQHREQMMDFIKKYYLTTENTFNTSTIEDINSIMTGLIHSSFVSFCYEPIIQEPTGCLVSHCYNVSLNKYGFNAPLYYLDFLSIRGGKNQGALRETTYQKRVLIQNHLYYQRVQNPSVQLALFKKEGLPIDGLVPFVKYKSHLFLLGGLGSSVAIGHHFTIVRIYNENHQYLKELLESRKFEISIWSDVSNLIGLIKQELLFAFVLKNRGDVCGYYFIRWDRVEWEQYNYSTGISLISSWNGTFPEIFYRGFVYVLREILRENKKIGILKIDGLSDNVIIASRWMIKNSPFMVNDNSYYFYNLVYPYYEGSTMNTKCFILI